MCFHISTLDLKDFMDGLRPVIRLWKILLLLQLMVITI